MIEPYVLAINVFKAGCDTMMNMLDSMPWFLLQIFFTDCFTNLLPGEYEWKVYSLPKVNIHDQYATAAVTIPKFTTYGEWYNIIAYFLHYP